MAVPAFRDYTGENAPPGHPCKEEDPMRLYQPLTRWQFCPGKTFDPAAARPVTLPHTWNIAPETENLCGPAWYRCTLPPCPGPRRFVRFGAVYRDAQVFLNGQKAGEHTGSGYTPFTVELTPFWNETGDNLLEVQADNRFSPHALPYEHSFDWANDGGLIRPVQLWGSGSHCIRDCRVTASPCIPALGRRLDKGAAEFSAAGFIDGAAADGLTLVWRVCPGEDEAMGNPLDGGELPCTAGAFTLPVRRWENVRFWHFDAPNLYTLTLELYRDGVCVDGTRTVFGFRDLQLQGAALYLNGEKVRLCGTEWMPGSDPAFGMAEPVSQLEKMLTLLKQSNCVLTRFHWQQDDAVYDWCDRHGMLVQEEIPFWGKEPPAAGPEQLAIFRAQMGETVRAHGNHPSIIAWGVGNELDAQNEDTIRYIRQAVAETRALDPGRFADYVTNTIYADPARDGTTCGDLLMINDYIGTWHGDLDPEAEWRKIVQANPDRAMIPAEFGLCEPAFSGGDERRERIFREKMAQYRDIPNVAGTIYFCLNDYRTHMGEDGNGRLRRRVHGSTDWSGNPKPSYEAVRAECSPLLVCPDPAGVKLTCRDTLPGYTVAGYRLCLGDRTVDIPTLHPGESWLCPDVQAGTFTILRPTGFPV